MSYSQKNRYATYITVCLAIVGLMTAYLFYRTRMYESWNGLAFFETGILIACGVFLLAAASYLLLKDDPKYEIVFFMMVLFFGILYMLVITPLSVPDEHYHYEITYKITNFLMGDGNSNLVYADYNLLASHSNVEGGYVRLLEDFGGSMPENAVWEQGTRTASYHLCYFPQAIGLLIGRLLNRNFITIFELGRFTNLLFYAFCVYVAVKNIPRFKVLLGVISLMPMAMHQAASFSTDPFINGLSFVLIAYAFKMIWSEQTIERRDIIAAVITAVLLAPAKVVYCSIFLLFFLIPSEKFGTRKRKIRMLCTMIISAGVFILLFQSSSILNLTENSASILNWEGQQNYDLAFVFAHPLQTVKIFVDTLVYYHEIWLRQAVGSTLSGLNLPVNYYVISAYMFTIIACIYDSHKEKFYFDWKQRIVCVVAACGILFLTMASMFLGWTSNTRTIIEGVQGRYFIPALPLLVMPLTIRKVTIPDKIMNFIVILSGGLNVLVIAEVLRLTLHSIIAY